MAEPRASQVAVGSSGPSRPDRGRPRRPSDDEDSSHVEDRSHAIPRPGRPARRPQRVALGDAARRPGPEPRRPGGAGPLAALAPVPLTPRPRCPGGRGRR
ncbi:hypothetical protein FRIGORI9N_390005 [Frigoribacterium sp. 9N]|nr:hypothetical protein FRIGORI9N_390005 [Frigoribacterium sp. 9N]